MRSAILAIYFCKVRITCFEPETGPIKASFSRGGQLLSNFKWVYLLDASSTGVPQPGAVEVGCIM
eukprot:1158370-Pelagomonas_calceolata.AAC.7